MKSKLIACNVPASSKNHGKIASFYSRLIGVPPARSFTDEILSSHIPLSNDGHFLFISDRQAEDEQISCVFAVDDLDEMVKTLEAAGGKLFAGPFIAPISKNHKLREQYASAVRKGEHNENIEVTDNMSRAVLIRDPEQNTICLMELEKHAEMFFSAGLYHEPLNAERANMHLSVIHAGNVHLNNE